MPCYDSRNTYDYGVKETEEKYKAQLDSVNNRNRWLEAALCAIFTELEKREIIANVLADSSRNGLIGIVQFWKNHQESDEARILQKLHSFSKHEQEIMKKILNEAQ